VKEKKEKTVVTYNVDTPAGHKKGSVQLFYSIELFIPLLTVLVEGLIYQYTLLSSEHTVMCVSSLN